MSSADAQSHPSAASWQRAEATVRAHYAAQGRALLDVAHHPPGASMGTTFHVRFAAGGSALAVVRGGDVIDARGDASVGRVLQADRMLATHAWRAEDLLDLLRELGGPLPLARNVIGFEFPAPVLRPRLVYGPHGATLTVYASRDVHQPEASPRPRYDVTRAVLTIDPSYALAWTSTEVSLPAAP